MKEIIVTGGRDYSNRGTIQKTLGLFHIGLLIQGGASGADLLAKEYAEDYDVKCITVEADWTKHGRAAGPIRNREMLLKYPNAIVIAFPGGRGTEDCIRQAVSMKRTVLMVRE